MSKITSGIKVVGAGIKRFSIDVVIFFDTAVFIVMGAIQNKWKFDIAKQVKIMKIMLKVNLVLMLAIIVLLVPSEIISILPVPPGSQNVKPYLNIGASISLVIVGFILLFGSFYIIHLLNRIHIGVKEEDV